ncbi:MAG: class I SAM-dependent methyltransferase [Candidatus Eisenbacteria bacterium]
MPLIRGVSDTARWVAMYRAIESARPDALFRDPYADRLGGEVGRRILDGIPEGRRWGWPMIVRTAVMDEIIQREVEGGVDTVVNLAAGMDMRPFRLDLPSSLRWVEVDLPEILDEKIGLVGGEPARCRLERIAADLSQTGERRDALRRAVGDATRALVVCEGLLIYLEPAQVAALADDLAAVRGVREWLIDLASSRLLLWMSKRWGKVVAEGGAPFRFAPEQGTAFFEPHGWREREFRSALDEARRLNREMPGAWVYRLMAVFQPPKMRAVMRRFSGYVLLERAAER